MRLIFTLFISFVFGVSGLSAQDFPLQFADANGNIIADGTELTLDQPTVEASEFDDAVMILSGVYVKNTTADDVTCGTEYSITHYSNGDLQTCFPSSCIQRHGVGSWQSEVGVVQGNELKNMQTESPFSENDNTLAERCGTSQELLQIALQIFIELGLVVRDGDRFRLVPHTKEKLRLEDSKTYRDGISFQKQR